jgi:hypothetical protein
MRELDMILFVTATPAIDASIKEASAKVFFPRDKTQIAFMDLKSWKKDPATANVEINGHTMTLSQWVENQNLRKSRGKSIAAA